MFSSDLLQQHFVRDCEAAGLYSAPYAYNDFDLESCITSLRESFRDLQTTIPLLSLHGTIRTENSEYQGIHEQILEQILCQPAHVDLIFEGQNLIADCANLRLIPIGPCSEISDVGSGLSKRGLNVSVFQTSYESMLRAENADSSTMDKIAIVGMSGRFPGGQNTEEFCKPNSILHIANFCSYIC